MKLNCIEPDYLAIFLECFVYCTTSVQVSSPVVEAGLYLSYTCVLTKAPIRKTICFFMLSAFYTFCLSLSWLWIPSLFIIRVCINDHLV